jgi:polar amino acid transport system substrate-binding protein
MQFKPSTLLRTAALAFVFTAMAQAALADQMADIKKAGKIRIAVAMGTPLFSFADANLKPAGSDVETADALAKDLGVEWELVSIPNSARIPTLQANKADIVVADLSITEERKKVIDFSRPYAVITLIVAGPKSVAIKDYADLAGKKIAVTRATVNDSLVTQNAKGAEVVRFEDDATLITSVITSQTDIFSSTPSNLHEIEKRAPGRNIERKFDQQDFLLGIALNKNEPALKAWVDAWVATNIKNGRLNAIYKKYHGRDLPATVTAAP